MHTFSVILIHCYINLPRSHFLNLLFYCTAEALNNCHAFVTNNSTASVDSCVRGVPTFVTSDLALCWPVANTNLEDIENPKYPDRTQWVNDLGYKMWSIKEIRDGTVYKRFKSKLGL